MDRQQFPGKKEKPTNGFAMPIVGFPRMVEIRGGDGAVFADMPRFEEHRTKPVTMRNTRITHRAPKHKKLHFVNRFVAKSWQENRRDHPLVNIIGTVRLYSVFSP